MQSIEKILEEIYNIDPSLKSKEEEIKKIIYIVLESKPHIEIDQKFIDRLKNDLNIEYDAYRKRTTTTNWLDVFYPRLIGELAVALIIAVSAPIVINRLYEIKPTDIEKPIVKNTDGSIVVNTSDGGVITKEPVTGKIIAGFVRFGSEGEYRKYLENSEQSGYDFAALPFVPPLPMASMKADGASAPGRVSETNVQVAGIDEPDILKTNGKEIFFASQSRYYYEKSIPMPVTGIESIDGFAESILPPEYNKPKTHIIKAFPIGDFSRDSAIDKAGDLLLAEDILVIFDQKNIYGYDISNPRNPIEKWNIEIDDRNSIIQARLYGGKIYLITRTDVNRHSPCVVPLFKTIAQSVSIACQDIYHPTASLFVNTNYHISMIDPTSGVLRKGVSFLGSYDSTVYMSKGNVYVAYAYQGDHLMIIYDLFKENGDIVPKKVTDSIVKLLTYEISNSSKMAEFEIIFQDYLNSLDRDDALRIQNEIGNRSEDYLQKHKRDLVKTDIVKINVKDFSIDSIGTVSGKLLNQFSMDEYAEHLRIATTVGGVWFRFGGSPEQENDVYVLDTNLSIVGAIKGLGLSERIYSARFVHDKGYLVTFRQTDPFYVLDLSNPQRPAMRGELKIPGYSAYLHPISKDRILGVGKEGSKIKVSLFDVTDSSNPKEADKYLLEEYWSDILNTQHAFLLDDKYKVFFMPGGRGGYVISYNQDKLEIKRAISDISAKRALFINDFLYVVGEDKIIVLDENTWDRVSKLELVN